VIAKAKDLEPSCLDHRRTSRIFSLGLVGKMLSAIEFDDQLCRLTHEIGDEVAYRNLTSEAGPVQPMIA
jgi:hypothetical protein